MSTTIIIVTGIPGSGKTSILNQLTLLSSQLKVVNYGEKMLQEAASHDIDRDTLRKLPLIKQQEIGLVAARKIANEAEGTVIIDTHAFIKTPFGFCPGIPENILKILDPRALVAIESRPQLIYERRKQDRERTRDHETIEEIEQHQCLNREFLAASSALSGALVAFVQNNGEVREAAAAFQKIVTHIHIP